MELISTYDQYIPYLYSMLVLVVATIRKQFNIKIKSHIFRIQMKILPKREDVASQTHGSRNMHIHPFRHPCFHRFNCYCTSQLINPRRIRYAIDEIVFETKICFDNTITYEIRSQTEMRIERKNSFDEFFFFVFVFLSHTILIKIND